MRIAFVVAGHPVPKGRPRSAGGRWYTPKSTAEYERRVKGAAWAALVLAGFARYGSAWPKGARFRLELMIVPGNARRFDLDNVAKAVCDALNGIAWDDDSQVWTLVIRRGEIDRTSPRVEVKVEAEEVQNEPAKPAARRPAKPPVDARGDALENRAPHLPPRRVSARRTGPLRFED
jgi:Holliday junction resolvase RusA-like endonuclease